MVVFFFKQKTAYEMRISDWSSDVCSSDLDAARHPFAGRGRRGTAGTAQRQREADVSRLAKVDARRIPDRAGHRRIFGLDDILAVGDAADSNQVIGRHRRREDTRDRLDRVDRKSVGEGKSV